MLAALFFVGALIGAWHTFNAMRPLRRLRFGIGPLWVPALLTGELVPHHFAWQAVLTAIFVWAGALESPLGVAALAITAVSWAGLAVLVKRSAQAAPTVEEALRRELGGDFQDRVDPALRPGAATFPSARLLLPVPLLPAGVERERAVPYGEHPRQRLDVVTSAGSAAGVPVLVQIHGGGWMRGRRDRQARPLLHHLAEHGWACVAAGYRTSPEVAFPAHLVDLKRVLAWVRSEGQGRGWDTGFVAVTGGSAGGHLAAMLALTQNDPAYQPGFEDADTSVSACIPIYAILDLLDDTGRPWWPFLERAVLQVSPDEDPEVWRRASPRHIVGPDAPPFFVIHGAADSLVGAGISRRFVAALRAVSSEPVVHAEIPGGTHGLEYFSSLRSRAVVAGIDTFLAYVRSRRHDPRPGEAPGIP